MDFSVQLPHGGRYAVGVATLQQAARQRIPHEAGREHNGSLVAPWCRKPPGGNGPPAPGPSPGPGPGLGCCAREEKKEEDGEDHIPEEVMRFLYMTSN